LALATLVVAHDAGLAMPAAAVCLLPWVDLEGTGESMKTRRDVDPLATPEGFGMVAQAYLAGNDPRTPLAAPLYADLKGLPPLLIQVGDHETLLDSTRVAERARQARVHVTVEVWPEMIHVWQFFGSFLPEGQQAIDVIGKFIREHTA
jgi:acetyl esterase/lipase